MNKTLRFDVVVTGCVLALVMMLPVFESAAIAETGTPAASPELSTASNAVYLTIESTGDAADRLLGASSPVAAAVEIRTMQLRDGVLQPVALPDGLEIPAGESLVLQPGKAHLMLLGVHQGFAEGFTFALILNFERAGSIAVEIPVLANAPAAADAVPVTVGDIAVSAGWSRPFELADDQCGCGIPDAAKQFIPVATPTVNP